jgi:UDP-2,3-diacylglucosamine hydrolase
MKNLFISDLHLDESHPEMARLFLTFLHKASLEAQALYILGDFFEAWIGDDDLTPFNLTIIQALKKATDSGLKIFLMHGNRDFVIGKKFLKMTGCVLLPEEYVVNLHGTPTLLMHGDTLCSDDIAYLKFRRKARIKFLQNIFFLWWPLSVRRKKAAMMRAKSKEYTSTAPEKIMDVTQAEVERVMQKHGVQHLIHGHTHRPNVHHFQLNNHSATRTVLGAWHSAGSVLVCDETGKQTLEELIP